jgi:hypothetical protein
MMVHLRRSSKIISVLLSQQVGSAVASVAVELQVYCVNRCEKALRVFMVSNADDIEAEYEGWATLSDDKLRIP